MMRVFLAGMAMLLPCEVGAQGETKPQDGGSAVEISPRPGARPEGLDTTPTPKPVNLGFQRWIKGFKARAQAKGIPESVITAAFDGVRYNDEVIARDRNQSEFTKAIWDYLDSAVSLKRIENGQAAMLEHGDLLGRIEEAYGVPAEVVTAVWGMETSYGSFRGGRDLVESLATLAYDGRRGAFFEAQLVAALEILAAGDVPPRQMTGSWAGAMGHTQFIPTSYLLYAVDFTGDGKRDIWGEDPADALASTAAYLAKAGWQEGRPWGIEVRLPKGFDYALAGTSRKAAADWAGMGILTAQGEPLPDHGPSELKLPAGARGPALLAYQNFKVISRYNAADTYVIGVGHLSDRIRGGVPFVSEWPREDRALNSAERKELQGLLQEAGFEPGGIDGKIGPRSKAALRAYQAKIGVVPDGFASYTLLQKMRR